MFDVNCAVGHWPFRELTRNTPDELKAYLREYGVTGAALTHNHAACYQNVQDANLELARLLESDGDGFFRGVATLNPLYALWERDLPYCVEKLGFRALRLLPRYHNYSLEDAAAADIITAAGELGIPVMIPNELVNYRQRFWMEPGYPLGHETLTAVARRFPSTQFIFMELAFPEAPSEPYPSNAFFEMSRFRCCYGRQLDTFMGCVGADHILFGSGAPFKEIEPALLKLNHLRCSPEEYRMISEENACRWFGFGTPCDATDCGR